MPLVLDSSIALAWMLDDERSADADAVVDQLQRDSARVPAIWPLEVGNALVMAMRRGRVSGDEVARMVKALLALPIDVDSDRDATRLPVYVQIAHERALTTYDASYLELAQRLSLPLATLDRRLRAACADAGIAVIP